MLSMIIKRIKNRQKSETFSCFVFYGEASQVKQRLVTVKHYFIIFVSILHSQCMFAYKKTLPESIFLNLPAVVILFHF